MEFPNEFKPFIDMAVYNGTRAALQIAKHLPILEAVMVIVRTDTNQLVGIRVLFEPPVEPAFVLVNGDTTYADYDQKRKDQAPLTARYYVIPADDIGTYANISIYENAPSQ